jgi:hypothetical protein
MNKTRTTLYNPQSDGLLERMNRTLFIILSHFVDNNQRNWDEILPSVMTACRSSVQSSTGFTPCRVLFGAEMTLPVDVVMGTQQNEGKQCVSHSVKRVEGYLSTVREAVKRNHLKATGKQKQYFDLNVSPQRYEENEYTVCGLETTTGKRGRHPN